jgi:hypothetical protein
MAQGVTIEREIRLIAPPKRHVVAQEGTQCPTAMQGPTVEPSSWSEWLKHPLATVLLRWEQAMPP